MYRKLKYTRWLISRFSGTGLCQLILQITTYSPFFDLSFEHYGFTLTRAFLGPNDIPWTLKDFSCSGSSVSKVVMLAYPTFHIIAITAIISAGCLTLNDVNPIRHQETLINKAQSFDWAL